MFDVIINEDGKGYDEWLDSSWAIADTGVLDFFNSEGYRQAREGDGEAVIISMENFIEERKALLDMMFNPHSSDGFQF